MISNQSENFIDFEVDGDGLEIYKTYDGSISIETNGGDKYIMDQKDQKELISFLVKDQAVDVEPCAGVPVDEIKELLQFAHPDAVSDGVAADFAQTYPDVFEYLRSKVQT